MEYNHNRALSAFQEQIDLLRSKGFAPIAVSQIFFEDTFVFETSEEAHKAFELCECSNNEIIGFWYGKSEFLAAVEDYEKNDENYKVRIHWIQ
jgi:hypothetical protein